MALRLRRNDLLLLIGAITGLALFILIYPNLSPEAAIKPVIARQEVITRGELLIEELGFELNSQHVSASIKYDKNQIQYLNRNFGTREANRIMTDSIPVFYWQVEWRGQEKESTEVTVREGSGEEARSRFPGGLILKTSLDGRPLSFETHDKPTDNAEGSPPHFALADESECRTKADDLAKSLIPDLDAHWTLTSHPDTTHMATACMYKWERNYPVAGQKVALEVEVANGKILGFKKEYLLPTVSAAEEKRQGIYEAVSFIIQYVIFILLGLFYFVIRLKSDALDLKSGLVPALLILISWAIVFWMQVSGQKGWEILIGFVITTPFVVGGVWLMFVLGEAMTREVWADKLTTVDGLRMRFFFPALGRSILRGLAFGALLVGFYAVLALAAIRYGNGYFSLGDSTLNHWSARLPALHILAMSLLGTLYVAITYCLFFQSWIRRKIKSTVWGTIILLIFWSMVSLTLPDLLPFPVSGIVNVLLGASLFLFFGRFDFISTAVAILAMSLFYYGTAALFLGGGFVLHGVLIFLILLIMGIYAWISLRAKVLPEQLTEYTPDYMQRVYERQRIQRELEIARNVQLTFLPRSNPKIPGMEIASSCIPAMEVGGDYFDFVWLGPRTLGIAIGDVSGKGIPAAFYMTLTKGLFKAQAQAFRSPREVLVNLNTLFYENAERGIFISMIYAIFDMDAKKLVMARAGHNPMLIRRPDAQMAEEICPPGLALGFEQGEVFAKTIQEETFEIRPGDVFLFYTDGLNEAQNRFNREYGEERLNRLLQDSDNESAEALLNRIRQEIQQFTGDAPQHDDMTAVAVKILELA